MKVKFTKTIKDTHREDRLLYQFGDDIENMIDECQQKQALWK